MSDTIHGVSLSDYAAALGAMSTYGLDVDSIFQALNINAAQWTEVCTQYQFAAMTDMGTYMQYFGNPSLCPKFSNLGSGGENGVNNSTAPNFFNQLMGDFADFMNDDDDDDFDHIEPIPADKKDLLCLGAVVLYQHPADSFEIYGDRSDLEDMLENAWKITNHEEAIETLEWLKEEGHRENDIEIDAAVIEDIKEYQQVLSPLQLNIDEDGNVTNIDAWDIERIASVARYCYAADYIDQSTCLSYLETAKKMAQERYSN